MRSRLVAALTVALLVVGFALVAGGAAAEVDDEYTPISECAATPPDNFSDPDDTGIGWVDGYWYNESIDVEQGDTLTDDDLDAVVARSMARVEAIRCLEFEDDVPVDVIDREEFQEEQAGFEPDDDLRTFDNARYKALFMVGDDEDSVEVMLDNRGDAVGGYYAPAENRIVLVSDDPDELTIEEVTLGHELGHALQDQHFNLSRFTAETTDGNAAELGLIEGDVVHVENIYAENCDEEWDCLEEDSDPPDTDDIHMGLYLTMFQPYNDGPVWAEALRDRGEGEWDELDSAYDAPPNTTEQIIYPDRYLDVEPRNVTIDDRNDPDEWDRVSVDGEDAHDRFGQAAIVSMFVYPTYHSEGTTEIISAESWLNVDEGDDQEPVQPLDFDQPQGDGWDGDRFHAYENDDEIGYVWQTAWESEADARVFVSSYQRLLDYWGGERIAENDTTYVYEIPPHESFAGVYHVDFDGDEVRIVHAPSEADLPLIYENATVDDLDDVGDDPTPIATPTPVGTPTPTNDTGGVADGVADETVPGFGLVAVALVAVAGMLAAVRRR